ncbi:ABC transporter permease [Desulfobulbus alkaliphilus]|uniref:ABC transporter permease n=1 Tax=Desulfobulbus alkaliphilus TaxID=869814 RepID=UPI0019643DD8|nr:ABC transporter permease [Desulfobulbus alkaliphilus]MBM9537673.1 ABC transporter permease [Desulfobulbus alkaliphilus]
MKKQGTGNSKAVSVYRTRMIGSGLLFFLIAFGMVGPFLVSGDPGRQNLSAILSTPGKEYLLGTDHLGRDMLLRLTAAIRVSVAIALITTATASLIGVSLGILAATRGGLAERCTSLLADTFLALPGLLLVLLLVAIAPGSFWPLYLGIAMILWVEQFRMTRALVQPLATSPAVQATRLLGFGPWYVFRRHFWPELQANVLTLSAFGAATAILSVAALGFISVGIRPPTPELGQMMIELLPYYQEAPLIFLQPILILFLLVLSLNLIAGGKIR